MLNKEPLDTQTAKALILSILASCRVSFGKHALDEMAKDGLSTLDAINVMRGGVVRPADFINREWRYRVQTARMTFVVTFLSEQDLRVVTAWRMTR
jgi:hypothetical protein